MESRVPGASHRSCKSHYGPVRSALPVDTHDLPSHTPRQHIFQPLRPQSRLCGNHGRLVRVVPYPITATAAAIFSKIWCQRHYQGHNPGNMCYECAVLRICLCTEKRIQVQQPGFALLGACEAASRDMIVVHYGHRAEKQPETTSSALPSHGVAMLAPWVRVLEDDRGLASMFTAARSTRLKDSSTKRHLSYWVMQKSKHRLFAYDLMQ